jgi:hypothetical protein
MMSIDIRKSLFGLVAVAPAVEKNPEGFRVAVVVVNAEDRERSCRTSHSLPHEIRCQILFPTWPNAKKACQPPFGHCEQEKDALPCAKTLLMFWIAVSWPTSNVGTASCVMLEIG